MTAVAPAQPTLAPNPDTKQPIAWHVVLLDDDDHTYDYVIRMAQTLFAHSPEKALQVAKTVDSQGRVVMLTTHKEHAELKRDQIHAFGKDHLMARSRGSMSAVIEPADFDPEGGEGSEPPKA